MDGLPCPGSQESSMSPSPLCRQPILDLHLVWSGFLPQTSSYTHQECPLDQVVGHQSSGHFSHAICQLFENVPFSSLDLEDPRGDKDGSKVDIISMIYIDILSP